VCFLQQHDIFVSKNGRDDADCVSVPNEAEVHKQSCHPAVPVNKGVDKDKAFMGLCCKFNRMAFILVWASQRTKDDIRLGILSGAGAGYADPVIITRSWR